MQITSFWFWSVDNEKKKKLAHKSNGFWNVEVILGGRLGSHQTPYTFSFGVLKNVSFQVFKFVRRRKSKKQSQEKLTRPLDKFWNNPGFCILINRLFFLTITKNLYTFDKENCEICYLVRTKRLSIHFLTTLSSENLGYPDPLEMPYCTIPSQVPNIVPRPLEPTFVPTDTTKLVCGPNFPPVSQFHTPISSLRLVARTPHYTPRSSEDGRNLREFASQMGPPVPEIGRLSAPEPVGARQESRITISARVPACGNHRPFNWLRPALRRFRSRLSAHSAEHGFREPLGAFLPLARVFRELWVIWLCRS